MLTQCRIALRVQQFALTGLQRNGRVMQASRQRGARVGKEMFGDARKRSRSRRSGHYAPCKVSGSLFQSPARSCMPLRAGSGYISNTGSG
ncbi:hypothetical protein SGMN_15350 [Stenotrophomonas geniculata]